MDFKNKLGGKMNLCVRVFRGYFGFQEKIEVVFKYGYQYQIVKFSGELIELFWK